MNAPTSMFEAAELGRKLSKKAFAEREPELRLALLNAQYELRDTASPVLVLIGGDDRPGATALLNRLHEWMDARYLTTRVFGPATEAERTRPDFWRYWTALPRRGRVGVYLGGWAQSPIAARLEGRMDDDGFERWIERFRAFDEALVEDGAGLVKLWIHLPKAQHEARIEKAEKGKGDGWRLDEVDWHICDRYDELVPVAEELLRRTDRPDAPWHVIESGDARHRDVSAAERIVDVVARVLEAPRAGPDASGPAPSLREPSVLDRVDLTARLDYDSYKPKLEKVQRRLFELVNRAEQASLRTILVFEGWDAAGKGGAIRRLTRALDARDYRVIPFGAPTVEERAYHYLWRFWREIPAAGKTLIFDRSWYGRVLVERVEGFATTAAWQRAYAEINEFEAQLVEARSLVLKFWLHIDRDEQLRRFEEREQTPYKKHKITAEDYRNRDRWDAYVAAVHDMVERTSTASAPWHLVAANDKRWARVQVLETVADALKRATRRARKA